MEVGATAAKRVVDVTRPFAETSLPRRARKRRPPAPVEVKKARGVVAKTQKGVAKLRIYLEHGGINLSYAKRRIRKE